ncbi:MAG: NERD domain-containing protein [Scytolyngbya sp. HA4215-MV1]|nr:NERD domain-containing protein [Scytolyngbya sp. HA4215-MV1]
MNQSRSNLHRLAFQRRVKAVGFVGAALICLSLPILLLVIPNTALPGWVSFVLLVSAGIFAFQAKKSFREAKNVDQGIAGEDAIAEVLKILENRGWKIERNLQIRSIGDIDFLLTSPRAKTYILDAKSHRGLIFYQQKLQRRMGKKVHAFEKDFIAQMMKQVYAVKDFKKLTWITPLLVFSRARLNIPDRRIEGVYLAEVSEVIYLLECLDRAMFAETCPQKKLIRKSTCSE